jgi:hypothetical protein
VTYTPADTDNYEIVEGIPVSITVKTAADDLFVALANWTYGGTPGVPTVGAISGIQDIGAATYYYDTTSSGTFENESQPTNAGIYWIRAFVDESESHNAVTTAAVQFEIAQKPVTLTWSGIDSGDLVYNGNPKNVTATTAAFEPGDVGAGTIGLDVVSGDATEVGVYTASAILTGSSAGNYVLDDLTKEQQYEITARATYFVSYAAGNGASLIGTPISDSAITDVTTYTTLATTEAAIAAYKKANHHFAGWATEADGGGDVYAGGATDFTSATGGEITLYAKWAPNTNIEVDDGEGGTIIINEDTSIPPDGIPDKNIDYGGDEIPHFNTGDGTVNPVTGPSILYGDVPDPFDPNYWLNYDEDGDGWPDLNIDLDGDGTPDLNIDTDGDGNPDINIDEDGDGFPDRNIEIDPNDLQVSLAGWTYGSTPGTPTVSAIGGIEGLGTASYYYDTISAGAFASQTQPTAAGIHWIRAKIAANAPYNAVTTAAVQFTIAKATPSYTTPSGLTATAGAFLASVILPAGFAWEDDANATSVGAVGTNQFKVTFTPTDQNNFMTVGGITVSITVTAAAEAGGVEITKITAMPEKRIGVLNNATWFKIELVPAGAAFYNGSGDNVVWNSSRWNGVSKIYRTDGRGIWAAGAPAQTMRPVLVPGAYDVYFTGYSHLSRVLRGVSFTSGASLELDFSTGDAVLLAGDAAGSSNDDGVLLSGDEWGDDLVNALDITSILAKLNLTGSVSPETPGNISKEDLNGDGLVNALDITLGLSNLNKYGDKGAR